MIYSNGRVFPTKRLLGRQTHWFYTNKPTAVLANWPTYFQTLKKGRLTCFVLRSEPKIMIQNLHRWSEKESRTEVYGVRTSRLSQVSLNSENAELQYSHHGCDKMAPFQRSCSGKIAISCLDCLVSPPSCTKAILGSFRQIPTRDAFLTFP